MHLIPRLLLILSISNLLVSQTTGKITGTIKDAEMKAKADPELVALDEKIDEAEKQSGLSWAYLESHRIHIDLLRSYHSTKREELKQGL